MDNRMCDGNENEGLAALLFEADPAARLWLRCIFSSISASRRHRFGRE